MLILVISNLHAANSPLQTSFCGAANSRFIFFDQDLSLRVRYSQYSRHKLSGNGYVFHCYTQMLHTIETLDLRTI